MYTKFTAWRAAKLYKKIDILRGKETTLTKSCLLPPLNPAMVNPLPWFQHEHPVVAYGECAMLPSTDGVSLSFLARVAPRLMKPDYLPLLHIRLILSVLFLILVLFKWKQILSTWCGNKLVAILREHCSLPNLTEGKTAHTQKINCVQICMRQS